MRCAVRGCKAEFTKALPAPAFSLPAPDGTTLVFDWPLPHLHVCQDHEPVVLALVSEEASHA